MLQVAHRQWDLSINGLDEGAMADSLEIKVLYDLRRLGRPMRTGTPAVSTVRAVENEIGTRHSERGPSPNPSAR